MRTLLLLVVTGLCAACAPQNPQVDTDKESAAIQATIERFLQAHAERDYETWGHLWVHKPYVCFSAIGKDYDYYDSGWTNIYNGTKVYFMNEKKLDEDLGRTQTIEPSDYRFRIYDDNACAQFKINWESTYKDGKKPDGYVSREFYTLEKVDGQWKVASIIAVNTTDFMPPAPALSLMNSATGTAEQLSQTQ